MADKDPVWALEDALLEAHTSLHLLDKLADEDNDTLRSAVLLLLPQALAALNRGIEHHSELLRDIRQREARQRVLHPQLFGAPTAQDMRCYAESVECAQ